MASPCWGRAVRGFRRHHWRQVRVAALSASWAPVALAAGNLLPGVIPTRGRGNGLSLLGEGRLLLPASSHAPYSCGDAGGLLGASGVCGGQLARQRTPRAVTRPMASPCWGKGRLWLLVSSLAPGPCDGTGNLSCAICLGGGQPAWRRTPCAEARPMASPCWGRAVRGSSCSQRQQVLAVAPVASQAQSALAEGNLPGVALFAHWCVTWPLPAGGRAGCGSRRPYLCQVLGVALAASQAPAALVVGNLRGGVLPVRRHVRWPLPAGGGPSTAPCVLIGARSLWRRWWPLRCHQPWQGGNLLGVAPSEQGRV